MATRQIAASTRFPGCVYETTGADRGRRALGFTHRIRLLGADGASLGVVCYARSEGDARDIVGRYDRTGRV